MNVIFEFLLIYFSNKTVFLYCSQGVGSGTNCMTQGGVGGCLSDPKIS